jgi:hypothetical protein
MNAAVAWMWFIFASNRSSNRSNKKLKPLPRLTVMDHVRAWQHLKYMDTRILMRASGLRHEEDRDILQLVRRTND